MSKMFVLLLLLTLFNERVASEDDKEHIVQANIVFRHGDRTPVVFYKNDPYKGRDQWPSAPGQLLRRGKQRQIELGRYLRSRYRGWLNETYDNREVYCRSSDADRAIMSASYMIIGLYADLVPTPGPDLPLAAVHSVPKEYDHVVMQRSPCQYAQKLLLMAKNSDKIHSLNKEKTWLLETLTRHTGEEVKSIFDVVDIYDTLLSEHLSNKTLPKWTTGIFPDEMRPFFLLYFKLYTSTRLLKKYYGGPLIKEILNNMKSYLNHTDRERKLYVYAGHDNTVLSLLDTLKVFDDIPPPFSATVLVELILKSGQYFVKISYKNSSSEPHVLTLPGCHTLCPWADFLKMNTPYLLSNWDYDCGNSFIGVYALVIVILAVLLLLVLVILLVIIFKNKSRFKFPKQDPESKPDLAR